jgi:rod shape-determining protein MreB
VDVASEEIVEAVEEPLRLLVEGFHSVIERIPAELANDVFDDGIVLTGGGANLRGLSTVLQREMQIPVYVAEHPQECIALGCGLALERPGEYQRILGDARKRR